VFFLLRFLAGCSAPLILDDDDEEEEEEEEDDDEDDEEEGLSGTRGWSAGSASVRLVRCVETPLSPSSFLSALRSLVVDLQRNIHNHG
jgi:hypothetical protein